MNGLRNQLGTQSPAGEGVGGSNSDDWKESLVLCLLCVRFQLQDDYVLVIFLEHSFNYFCIVSICLLRFRPLLRIFGLPPS